VTRKRINGDTKRLFRRIANLRFVVPSRVDFPTPFQLPGNSSIFDFSIYHSDKRFFRSDRGFTEYYANLGFTWERFWNMTAVHFGGIYLRGAIFYYNYFDQQCEPHLNNFLRHYDVVFNFLHRWRYYGHYIIDYLPVLAAISDHFLKTPIFIVRQRTTFSVQAIQLFGVPNGHIVELKYGELIFARQLYMINPLQIHVMNAVLLLRMRRVFVRCLNLDDRRPFRFVLYNRPGKRWVTNFDAIFAHCENHYPSIRFELYQDEKQRQFRENLVYYNEMLFAMSCHSSGFLNIIFQQSNTVAVVVESRQSDGNLFPSIAKIFNRRLVVFRDLNFNHFAREIKLPLKKVLPAITKGIDLAIEIKQHYVRLDYNLPHMATVLGPDLTLTDEPQI
jgi:hypothetical protein